jgi:hypothetical protein
MPNTITIGNITTTNPSLWVDTNTLGCDPVQYRIASLLPGANWFEVNQFCALLSLKWLAARGNGAVKNAYGIGAFDANAQKAMAAQLIAFNDTGDGQKAQVNYAAGQVGGNKANRDAIVKGMAPNTPTSYPVGTKIWAGTNAHVIAYYVTSPTQYEVYDSNDGSITTRNRADFRTACTDFVVRLGAGVRVAPANGDVGFTASNGFPPIESLESIIQRRAYATRQATVQQMFRFARPSRARVMATVAMDAATSDDPPPGNIMDVINKHKQAPGATSIVAVPPSLSDNDMQNLNDIVLLDTYASVAGASYYYKLNPKGPDITTPDGAAEFTQKFANARFRIMTQGLPGVLSLQNQLATSFHKETTSTELHMEFLGQLFGSFGFAPSTMKELDGVMTNVVSSLTSLQASWSDQSQTLDHLISFYYFEPVMGLDAKVPKMRLFFLHVDQHSWTVSVGKSSVAHFEFNMNYDDSTFSMGLTQIAQSRQVIQDQITSMTNQSLESIKELLAASAVQDNKQQ